VRQQSLTRVVCREDVAEEDQATVREEEAWVRQVREGEGPLERAHPVPPSVDQAPVAAAQLDLAAQAPAADRAGDPEAMGGQERTF
jgi:hypothetical protein